jgi:hypothetical protein
MMLTIFFMALANDADVASFGDLVIALLALSLIATAIGGAVLQRWRG